MKRVILSGTLLFVALLTPALLSGAKPQRPPEVPTSAPATAARNRYEDEIDKLNQDYARRLDVVRQQYLKELEDARKIALTKEDLNEAQRLLTEKNQMRDKKLPHIPGAGLHILYARLGNNDTWVDIAPQLQKQIKASRLYIQSPGPSFPDPLFGVHKAVVIVYALNGRIYLSTTGTEDTISIP